MSMAVCECFSYPTEEKLALLSLLIENWLFEQEAKYKIYMCRCVKDCVHPVA